MSSSAVGVQRTCAGARRSGLLRAVRRAALGIALAQATGCASQPGLGAKRADGDLAQAATSERSDVSAAPADKLAGPEATPSSEANSATSPGTATKPTEAKPPSGSVPEFPAGSKVLQIGDSFAGALGIPLGKMLEARGVHSVLKAKDASYLTDWAWDGELQKQLWKYNPDLVVITLGANELKIGEPDARAKTVKKLVSMLEGRACVWIAIPLWDGPQNGLLEVIRKNASPCSYLDTNALMDTAHMARIEDGIHPTAAAREGWAKVVIAWLESHRKTSGPVAWSLED